MNLFTLCIVNIIIMTYYKVLGQETHTHVGQTIDTGPVEGLDYSAALELATLGRKAKECGRCGG